MAPIVPPATASGSADAVGLATPIYKPGAYICIALSYTVVTLMGFVVGPLAGVSPFLVPAGYFITAVLAYSTHVIGHFRIFSRWFRAHSIGHHVEAYPPSRFLADTYVKSFDSNGKYYIPSMFFPGLIAHVLGLSWPEAAVMMGTGLAAMIVADIVHYELHMRKSFLDRFALFRELRRLHVFHHKGNCKVNYSVYDFTFDILVGTVRWE
eukprot:m.258853 g.258853  ORF g.258853 m.258853 type:complete len:209 (+) comp21933_c0_seq1:120-746(+)